MIMATAERFAGQTVLVTGAGSGIGAATARRFATEAASLVLVDQDGDKLRDVAQTLDRAGVLTIAADVSDPDAVQEFIRQAVDRFGRLDVLVNNAGVVVTGGVADTPLAEWRRIMATDLDAVFYCTRAAVPHLIATKGCIVNVSSVSGLGGDWGMSFYNAAKGAVTNFTRALALDLGENGVRVNAVNPTFTRTGMTKDMQQDPELLAKFRARIPLGRPGEPEDIADAIAFLASDDARFITGVNLPVDGGLSASNGQPRQT
jgi:meso-butanediol dehydrogenase / (S,S)-butanediol dehydrogenase / diacetyl reductase